MTGYFLWLVLRKFLTCAVGQISPAGFEKANLVSMSRATTENDKYVSPNFVAATFENDIESEEVSGEKVWRNSGYFGSRKSDYSMEKVNFPENILFYMNQAYLTVKKTPKRSFILNILPQVMPSKLLILLMMYPLIH